MSKLNKQFNEDMEVSIKNLINGAEIHTETQHVTFKMPELPEGITEQSLVNHVNFINATSLAVEAATADIAVHQYPDIKQEGWTGQLEFGDTGFLVINSDVRLREEIGEDIIYANSETYVDYPHPQHMVDWYSEFKDTNMERVKKLFD